MKTFKEHFKTILKGDLLTESKQEEQEYHQFDCVVGNPPYTDKGAAKVSLVDKFTYLGLDCLKDGGDLCYVVPRSWMLSDHAGNGEMREKLTEMGLQDIKILDNEYFEPATVYTCYFNCKKGMKSAPTITSASGKKYVHRDHVYGNHMFMSPTLHKVVNKVAAKSSGKVFNFDLIYPTSDNMNKVRSKVRTVDKLKGGGQNKFEYTTGNYTTKDNSKYRVTHNFMGGLNRFAVDEFGILPPGAHNKKGYIQMACNSKHHAECITSFLKTKLARYIIDATRTSRTLSDTQFKFIPMFDNKKWTDAEAYRYFDITHQEQKEIEQYEPQGY